MLEISYLWCQLLSVSPFVIHIWEGIHMDNRYSCHGFKRSRDWREFLLSRSQLFAAPVEPSCYSSSSWVIYGRRLPKHTEDTMLWGWVKHGETRWWHRSNQVNTHWYQHISITWMLISVPGWYWPNISLRSCLHFLRCKPGRRTACSSDSALCLFIFLLKVAGASTYDSSDVHISSPTGPFQNSQNRS